MDKFTIAIIDEEEQQRSDFEFVFSNSFNVVQIDSFESIEVLIGQIKSENIDAVAIDYRLTEHNSTFKTNGDFLFKEIRKNLFEFPVFILTRSSDEVKKICKTVDPSFIIDKENIYFGKGEEEKMATFLDSIYTKISVYKNDLQEKINRVNNLEDLRKNNPEEFSKYESEFVNLNLELNKYLYAGNIQMTYFTSEANNKLNSLIEKAENILNRLDKK